MWCDCNHCEITILRTKQKKTLWEEVFTKIYKRFIDCRWIKNREDFTPINGTNDWHSRLGANIWTLGQYTTTRTRRQIVQITVNFEYTFNRFRLEYSNLQANGLKQLLFLICFEMMRIMYWNIHRRTTYFLCFFGGASLSWWWGLVICLVKHHKH